MEAPLGKGIFLIAAPSLRDPNFRQTVVLLCEHGAAGALGVVLLLVVKLTELWHYAACTAVGYSYPRTPANRRTP